MKKKIILLISLVFLLCGCTAEVNIEIDNTIIKEDVSIAAFANEYLTKDQLSSAFRTYIPAFAKDIIVDTMPDEKVRGVSYYDRTLKDLGTGYRFDYKYNFNFNNYESSRTVKEGFKSANVIVDNKEETILLSTSNGELMFFNQYPELSEVKVNITTSYDVKENNADYVNDNVYTWIFNKNEKKNIYLLLDSKPKEEEEIPSTEKDPENTQVQEEEEDSAFVKFLNEHPFLVVVLSLLLFLIVVFIVSKMTKIKYR